MLAQGKDTPLNRRKKLKRSILLVGGVGVGKTSLAEAVAKELSLQSFDPEEALRRQKKQRLCSIAEDIGLPQLRTLLLDLLLPFVECQPNAICPCPTLLATHPDFWELIGQSADGILLEGMPLVNYQHVIRRELSAGPSYLPEKRDPGDGLLRAKAKLFFYHRYWAETRHKLWAEQQVRITGDLSADARAISQKILAIQDL